VAGHQFGHGDNPSKVKEGKKKKLPKIDSGRNIGRFVVPTLPTDTLIAMEHVVRTTRGTRM